MCYIENQMYYKLGQNAINLLGYGYVFTITMTVKVCRASLRSGLLIGLGTCGRGPMLDPGDNSDLWEVQE